MYFEMQFKVQLKVGSGLKTIIIETENTNTYKKGEKKRTKRRYREEAIGAR